MTRKLRREIEREVEEFSNGETDETDPLVVYEHPETGAWYTDDECREEVVGEADPLLVLKGEP